MIRIVSSALLLSTALFLSVPAHANSGDLLSLYGLGNLQQPGNFYNGSGSTCPPACGVTFSSNFYGLTATSNGGSGNFVPTMTTNLGQVLNIPAALFICPGGPPYCGGSQTTGVINVAQGVSGGVNFFFTAAFSRNQTETVQIWNGANGTGIVLATIVLSNTNASCTTVAYCVWSDAGASFSGTAKSITFNGPADELGIADITLGSGSTAIPEPSSFYLLGTGLGVLSLGRIRRFLRL